MKTTLMKLSLVLAMASGSTVFANNAEESVINPSSSGLVRNYERMIVVNKDLAVVGDTNPTAFIDPLHQRMLALGYYTQADVNQLTADSIAFIMEYYGIDVTTGIYDPVVGSYISADWAYFPTEEGTDDYKYLVAFDTAELNRGVTGNWFANSSGILLVFFQNGVFPGGINAGKPYFANDVILYNHYDLLKLNSNWSKKHNRDQFLYYSIVPAKQFPNFNGSIDSVIQFECKDKQGKVGKGLITNVYNENLDGTRNELKRTVITWPNDHTLAE